MVRTRILWMVAGVLCGIPAITGAQEAGAPDADARDAIRAICERCHPPLPDGGWQEMTARPHSATELAFLLQRMEEEFGAFPSDQERRAIIDFLTGFPTEPVVPQQADGR